MDARAAKLALARQKLKDHQVKKIINTEAECKVPKQEKTEELTVLAMPTLITDGVVVSTKQEPIVNMPMMQCDNNNLEAEIIELQSKISQLEYDKNMGIENCIAAEEQVLKMKNELRDCSNRLMLAEQDIQFKTGVIQELQEMKASLTELNNNLTEQLDFTKNMLSTKQMENKSLSSQLQELTNKLEVSQVQLQQLTNGSQAIVADTSKYEEIEQLKHKNLQLEQQVKKLQKERDQINSHYEHYVAELNEQLNSLSHKNHDLSKLVEQLSCRETSLIEQISEMEIRLQNYKIRRDEHLNSDHSFKNEYKELEQNFGKVQAELQQLTVKYEVLQKQYLASEEKIIELNQSHKPELSSEHQDSISLSKLNADITSDKIAAQRATEQNKKLKMDIQELEEAFVKMSQDKLELTEKLTAEKYLSRELTIKLAEVEEKAKDMHVKLFAKDEEMMRLQSNYKNMKAKFDEISGQLSQINTTTQNNQPKELENATEEKYDAVNNQHCQHKEVARSGMPSEDAMMKLQERFLKIMGEVADLSDEKHRLEHIILQLQNETDTICEYVALYQQQRSLLKRRDEERSIQMTIFQKECDKLKAQFEELSGILTKFAQDKDLLTYFNTESRENDISRVMTLLSKLKQNSLIDFHKNNLDFRNFYPCSCCSGQLIEV